MRRPPGDFERDTTLPKGCYVAKATPSFAEDSTLTLAPGVHILFEEHVGLIFRDNQTLIAEGTATDPIVLTGARKVPGFWQGVVFDQGGLAQGNRLRHVRVEFGGGPPLGTSFDYEPGNVALIGTVDVRIDDSVLSDSAGFGFTAADGYNRIDSFERNELTRNELGALVTAQLAFLSASSTYTGNGRDFIVLNSGWGTLRPLGVPYYFRRLTGSGGLTIHAGTTLVFAAGAGLHVSDEGLQAIGTAEQPILFTGEEPTPGFWQGITLSNPYSNPRHDLQHVIVEYGGSSPETGNLKLEYKARATRATVQNCTFRHSGTYGIWFDESTFLNDDYEVTNPFVHNALGISNR